jgi:DNA-binding transcriptional regulator YiaG
MTAGELKEIRVKRLGISIESLAHLLHIHRNTVYRWEHGDKIPAPIDLALEALLSRFKEKEKDK